MTTPANGDKSILVRTADGKIVPFKITAARSAGDRCAAVITASGKPVMMLVKPVLSEGEQGIPILCADGKVVLVREASGIAGRMFTSWQAGGTMISGCFRADRDTGVLSRYLNTTVLATYPATAQIIDNLEIPTDILSFGGKIYVASTIPVNGVYDPITEDRFIGISHLDSDNGIFTSVFRSAAGWISNKYVKLWNLGTDLLAYRNDGYLYTVNPTTWAETDFGQRIGFSNAVKNFCDYGDGFVVVGNWGTGSCTPTRANYITSYSASGGWIDLGVFNNELQSCWTVGTDLYVAGRFTTIDGNPIKGLAKWDGVSWSAVGGGVNYSGTVIIAGNYDAENGKLVIMGSFNTVGTGANQKTWSYDIATQTSIAAYHIASDTWEGKAITFKDLRTSISSTGQSYIPNRMQVADGKLIIMGCWWINDRTGPFVWGGSVDDPLLNVQEKEGGGEHNDLYRLHYTGSVNGVASIVSNKFYIIGLLTHSGGVISDGLPNWDGNAWTEALPFDRTKFAPQAQSADSYPGRGHGFNVNGRDFYIPANGRVYTTPSKLRTQPLVELYSDADSYPIPAAWSAQFDPTSGPRIWWPDYEFYYRGINSAGYGRVESILHDRVANKSWLFGSASYCRYNPIIPGVASNIANVLEIDWATQAISRWEGDSAARFGETYPVAVSTGKYMSHGLVRIGSTWVTISSGRFHYRSVGATTWTVKDRPTPSDAYCNYSPAVMTALDSDTVIAWGDNDKLYALSLSTGTVYMYWDLTTYGYPLGGFTQGFYTVEGGKLMLWWLGGNAPTGWRIMKFNVTNKTLDLVGGRIWRPTYNPIGIYAYGGKIVLDYAGGGASQYGYKNMSYMNYGPILTDSGRNNPFVRAMGMLTYNPKSDALETFDPDSHGPTNLISWGLGASWSIDGVVDVTTGRRDAILE